jgi:hydroxymethylpyrimidine/phosphomethylpyrimidine kinase
LVREAGAGNHGEQRRRGGAAAIATPSSVALNSTPPLSTPRRCLTIAASDSGGGAGIQADLKAFAAAGCYGTSVVVAVTAQNTTGITAVHEIPPEIITAQLHAVYDDIGVDAAKTGALVSRAAVDAVADFIEAHPTTLVVDPVLRATTGGTLLHSDAARALVDRLFRVARVITPNLLEAQALVGAAAPAPELAERLVAMGAQAALITGGHNDAPVDHLFDGGEHVDIPISRVESRATHGSGCTHSATLAAELALGHTLLEAARTAAVVTAAAIAAGLTGIGAGEGPVDVLQATGVRQR